MWGLKRSSAVFVIAFCACSSRVERTGGETSFLTCAVDADCSGGYACDEGLCTAAEAPIEQSQNAERGSNINTTTPTVGAPTSTLAEAGVGAQRESDAGIVGDGKSTDWVAGGFDAAAPDQDFDATETMRAEVSAPDSEQVDGGPMTLGDKITSNASQDAGPVITATSSSETSAGLDPLKRLQGSWQGYIENFSFGADDSIQIELIEGTSGFEAKVNLWDGPALPPATDPNVGYPPAEFLGDGGFGGLGFGISTTNWYGGFIYTAQGVILSETRLRLYIDSAEVWARWCEMQSSYVWGEAWYGCLPNWGWLRAGETCSQTAPSGQKVERNCDQLSLCTVSTSPCVCIESGCSQGETNRASFDLAIEGERMVGSADAFGTIRLTHLAR